MSEQKWYHRSSKPIFMQNLPAVKKVPFDSTVDDMMTGLWTLGSDFTSPAAAAELSRQNLVW
ncbi:Ninein-Like Protein, partial [Manis pentadactyla]